MPIDIGELIIKKIQQFVFSAILVYISVVNFARNALFSQSLSHIWTPTPIILPPLALRVRGKYFIEHCMSKINN